MRRTIRPGLISILFWIAALGVIGMAWSTCSSCGAGSHKPRYAATATCAP